MMDAISESRLELVHPALAAKIRQVSDALLADNPPVTLRVTQGLRMWQEQQALYDEGRVVPGKIVTDAPPGHSWHQFGLAVDVVPLAGLQPDWNSQHPVWQRLIQVGISQGLTAGVHFRSFPDYPHFQLTGKFPMSPDDEARQILQNEGMEAVWKESGLEMPTMTV